MYQRPVSVYYGTDDSGALLAQSGVGVRGVLCAGHRVALQVLRDSNVGMLVGLGLDTARSLEGDRQSVSLQDTLLSWAGRGFTLIGHVFLVGLGRGLVFIALHVP